MGEIVRLPLNILVIDDSKDMAIGLKKYLIKKGFKVTGVFSVFDAVDVILKEKIDVFIVDVHLKNFSGISFLKSVKNRGDLTPVIMMSADVSPKEFHECLILGAYDFLFKPFRWEMLFEILQTIDKRNQRFFETGVIQ